jgi:hypothetical protein
MSKITKFGKKTQGILGVKGELFKSSICSKPPPKYGGAFLSLQFGSCWWERFWSYSPPPNW